MRERSFVFVWRDCERGYQKDPIEDQRVAVEGKMDEELVGEVK